MCPICTVGVVFSLGLSKWLGVDDSISGVWIGALILAFSLWTFNWIFSKRAKKPIVFLLITIIAYWLLTILPLYAMHIISNVGCLTFFGLNRLVFGSLLGIVLSGLAIMIDRLLRKYRGGNRLFPYQKVIIPIGILLIVSFILNAICG
jgi:hypothetical protein